MNIFNIDRFWNLVKKEATAYYKQYLFIVYGLLAYFIVAISIDSIYEFNMLEGMPVIYVLLITCVAPFLDKNMDEKNKTFYLSTPVSSFERFVIMWSKNVIVLPLIIFVVSYILDLIASTFFNKGGCSLDAIDSFHYMHFMFAAQSVFMFGYIYFKKRGFIKILIAIAVFSILCIIISKAMIAQFYPEVLQVRNSMDPISVYEYNGYPVFDGQTYSKKETGTTQIYDVAKYIIMLIFPLGIWVLSYFRIKETEV